MKRLFSRRNVLRGTGVCLALPWLESLAPRGARAQAASVPKRWVPMFFPNGAAGSQALQPRQRQANACAA